MKTDLKRKTMEKAPELDAQNMDALKKLETFKDVFTKFTTGKGDGKDNNSGTVPKNIPEPDEEVTKLTAKFSEEEPQNE